MVICLDDRSSVALRSQLISIKQPLHCAELEPEFFLSCFDSYASSSGFVAERQVDVVEAVQKAVLAEGIDLEGGAEKPSSSVMVWASRLIVMEWALGE